MVERHTIETYGPQPNNRNIWSSRLADSFVCFSNSLYTTTHLCAFVKKLKLYCTEFLILVSNSVKTLTLFSRNFPKCRFAKIILRRRFVETPSQQNAFSKKIPLLIMHALMQAVWKALECRVNCFVIGQ